MSTNFYNSSNSSALKKVISLFSLLLFLTVSVQAQTFTTIGDGPMDSPAIWSIDGGATSCSCTPMSELPTFFILNLGSLEINHNVFYTKSIIIMGAGIVVNVNATGSLAGNRSLEVRSGVLNNYGNLSASAVTVQNGGFLNNQDLMNIAPGNLTNTFQGRINLAGRTNIPNGDFTNDGTIDIRGTATVFVGGRITNNEFINMEPSACLQVIGDMTNFGTVSLINGPGKAFIQSNSNINNLGIWDTNVDYCAGGSTIGLVHQMNCTTCGILPVELAGFEAELNEGQVTLSWETTSEIDNSFFTIERSEDGETFESFMEISSDNPVSGKVYQAYDQDPYFGISYYRLSQTDHNGATTILETVMVNNVDEAVQHFNAFPNPFQETIRVTTFGMEGAPVTIQVLDLSGREVARKYIEQTADFSVYEIQPEQLPTGMYIVNVTGNQVTESFKLMHP